jgi:hypothetical protein
MKLSPHSELCRRYSIDELHGVDSLTARRTTLRPWYPSARKISKDAHSLVHLLSLPSFLLSSSSSRPRVSRNVNYTGSGTPIWLILTNKSRVSL